MPYKDPAKHRARSLERYHADPAADNERALLWRKNNPEAWAAIQARSHKKTRKVRKVRAAANWAALDAEGRRAAADKVRDWRVANPEKYILLRLRQRAKKLGLPFDLDEVDVLVPSHCPVLGLKLDVASVGQSDASPSVDRIVARLGYVKGNVRVISMKANRIKNDATIEELQLVLEDLRRLHGCSQ